MELMKALYETHGIAGDESEAISVQAARLAEQVFGTGKGGDFDFYTHGKRYIFRLDNTGKIIAFFYAKRLWGEG